MSGFDTIFLFKQKDGEWSSDPLEWHNRGFLFGDGLFETMVFRKNKIRFSGDHELRLLESADILGLDRTGISSIQEIEKKLNRDFPNSPGLRVRWNIYRSGQGKYSPLEHFTDETLQIEAYIKPGILKVNSFVSDKIRVGTALWSNCKTLNSLTYVMANHERINKKMDEVILLSYDGLVSEAGSSNIFWVKDNAYFTPSLKCNCIAGVGRKQIIRKLTEQGIEIIEGEFLPVELIKADKIFTSNVTGVSYIQKIGDWEFDTDPDQFIVDVFD